MPQRAFHEGQAQVGDQGAIFADGRGQSRMESA